MANENDFGSYLDSISAGKTDAQGRLIVEEQPAETPPAETTPEATTPEVEIVDTTPLAEVEVTTTPPAETTPPTEETTTPEATEETPPEEPVVIDIDAEGNRQTETPPAETTPPTNTQSVDYDAYIKQQSNGQFESFEAMMQAATAPKEPAEEMSPRIKYLHELDQKGVDISNVMRYQANGYDQMDPETTSDAKKLLFAILRYN